jgi:hypothetical protein
MSIYTVLGIVVLALGVSAARFLQRAFRKGKLGRVLIFAEVLILLAGTALGIAAVGHSRYPTPDTRLVGFPFLAAVFQHSPGGGWTDFVGFRTLPATIGNFAVGLFLPHLLFAAAVWVTIRRHHAPQQSACT